MIPCTTNACTTTLAFCVARRNGVGIFVSFLVHCFLYPIIGNNISRDSDTDCSINRLYKKVFAKMESNSARLMKGIMAPLKQKIFVELSHHLKEVEGDVLEIGIGAGENFHLYPEGTSLIAVDSNPHVEKLLTENLKKAGDRVHLKRFVVASAEDMSCSSGKPGVEDNSIAAVVCTMVLCSLTDDQTTKTLAEVKRVLMPVSTVIALASPSTPLP